jgi:hypothetical protein
MAQDSYKVKKSLNIGGNSAAGNEAGDLRVDSSASNKLKYHDGTTEEQIIRATDAADLEFDPTGTPLISTNIQDAGIELFDEIAAVSQLLDDHIADAAGAHAATAISNTPAGSIAATTVQAAIDELNADTTAVASDLTTHMADTTTHGTTGDIVGTTDTQTLTNKTVGIANGLVGTPSLNFTSDTDTGIYRVGADSLGIAAGGFLGVGVGKSTGSFANVGMGIAPSSSDQLPLGIERSNASAGTYIHVGNLSTSANSFGGIKVLGDNSAISANINAYTAASTVAAFVSRAVFRADGNSTGISIMPLGSGGQDVRFYHSGGTATDESLRINTDKSIQFMQQIATPATPASNTVKMYQKSDDSLYVLNDAGTEAQIRTGTVAIANGGTGQVTAQAAIDALVPSQAGNSGKFLTTNATTVSWGTPAGSALSVRSVTTTDSPSTSDDVLTLSGASFTVTLYTAVGNTGKTLTLIHNGTSLSQVYTLNTTSAQTIGGIASGSYKLVTAGEVLKIISDGSNWLILDHKALTALTAYTPDLIEFFGTTTSQEFFWKRVGDMLHVRGSFVAGTVAGTGPEIPLPTGAVIDTTKLGGYQRPILGTSAVNINTTAGDLVANVYPRVVSTKNGVTDAVALYGAFDKDSDLAGALFLQETTATNTSTGESVAVEFAVPIVDWQP